MFRRSIVAAGLLASCLASDDVADLIQASARPTKANFSSNGTPAHNATPGATSNHSAPTSGNKPMSATQGQVQEAGEDTENDAQLSSLLAKPESVFKAMTEQVGSLSGELDQVRAAGQQTLANQQATFEKKLKEQREANDALQTGNGQLSDEIAKLTTTNRQLWQRGKDLQKENEQHREELRDMRARVGDAVEFADTQLKELADVQAPEEAVISELDQLDTERQENTAHQESLHKIASAGGAKVAMLDIDPAALLKTMQDSVNALNAEQKASEAKLREIFKNKFEAEATTRASLVEDQTRLTAKKESLTSMLGRLTDAVKHLETIRDGLKQAITSLSSFAEKVGKEHADKQATSDKKVSLSEEGPMLDGNRKEKGWLSGLMR